MKALFENWRQYTKEISETTLLEEVEKEENQSVLVENDRIRAKLARDIKRREKRIAMKRKRLERAKKKGDGAKAFKIKKDNNIIVTPKTIPPIAILLINDEKLENLLFQILFVC